MVRLTILLVLVISVMLSVSGVAMSSGTGERSIHIKGVFLLVDEVELLNKIRRISSETTDRYQFLDRVYTVLGDDPLVASSSIRFSWPNEVTIEINEISPVARFNGVGLLLSECQTIDASGSEVLLSMINVEIEKLPDGGSECEKLMKVIMHARALSVDGITVRKNGEYVLHVNERNLLVGLDEITRYQARIKQIISRIREQRLQFRYIDIRYPSGMAVRERLSS